MSKIIKQFEPSTIGNGWGNYIDIENFTTNLSIFNTDISTSMFRLKHFNEIIKILYNQTHTLKKTKKWVEMLLQIFIEIKSQIIKNII
jgi:hypothetical protein